MATHKQAVKRHRQSLKKRARNIEVKGVLRSQMKQLRSQIQAKSDKEITAALRLTTSLIAKAARKGVIPKERANRQIARLSKTVHQITK